MTESFPTNSPFSLLSISSKWISIYRVGLFDNLFCILTGIYFQFTIIACICILFTFNSRFNYPIDDMVYLLVLYFVFEMAFAIFIECAPFAASASIIIIFLKYSSTS